MPNAIIPQEFIDSVQLQLDEVLQTLKDLGEQGPTVERLAVYLYDKKGLITDAEHRQILTIMVAILAKRVTNA